MFRRYRCQYEAAQKQSDGTCFASLSRKLRDAKACRHHQRDRVAGKNGSTFPVKSKAEYRWGYRKIRSTPSCQNACAFSISRNLSSADSLRRDIGSRRRNRLNTTLRAGAMESAFNNPNVTSFSAEARGTMAIPPSDCTIILMVSILSTTARILGLIPRAVHSDRTTWPYPTVNSLMTMGSASRR